MLDFQDKSELTSEMKGVFLGAGASYEVGMPLVWEFTQTLRENILKRLDSKLFNFEADDELKSFFIEVLSNEDIHYEQIVGLLEKNTLKIEIIAKEHTG
ncbi:hypothetical protein [Aidingimonas lacisalsi]|uniref:hypothetical protein n=1 Tax=Aidingimonas lacisalsi TaxID=2604086 RepID=UPI0011D21817|nr:hypothetical protein [Aidingimonas lacisalsi]